MLRALYGGGRGSRLGVTLALGALGCGAVTPINAPREPEAVAATPGKSQEAPVRRSNAPHVRVELTRVVVDDKELSGEREAGKVHRIAALFDEMQGLRKRSGGSPYELEVGDEADGYRFKSAFFSAAFAGWPNAALTAEGKTVLVRAWIPTPDESGASSVLRDRHLVFVVRSDGVELWRAAPAPASEATPESTTPAPEVSKAEDTMIGHARGATARAELRAWLANECERDGGCSPALLILAGDAPFSMLRQVTQALADATASSKRLPALELVVKEPGAPGVSPQARELVTIVKGRLEPAVIQRVVRENYAKFRHCFEQGLGRNANLRGRISMRFVIGRDGTVLTARAEPGSDLPDPEAIRCSLDALKTIVFPKPEGGIVTVVYPILFEPG